MAQVKSVDITAEIQKGSGNSRQKYYRKNTEFFKLVEKLKLWPSRAGTLHGIKAFVVFGNTAEVTTHCGEKFTVRNSRNSRAARWLKNKWCLCACGKCKIPSWKVEKYSTTVMTREWGANL